jgi:hypothetical protein
MLKIINVAYNVCENQFVNLYWKITSYKLGTFKFGSNGFFTDKYNNSAIENRLIGLNLPILVSVKAKSKFYLQIIHF